MKSAAVQEFWIQKGTPDLIADSFQEAESFCYGHRSELPVIHVIEYSALDAERARSEKLRLSLERIKSGSGRAEILGLELSRCPQCASAEIAREALQQNGGGS